jgi:hypothetical protein
LNFMVFRMADLGEIEAGVGIAFRAALFCV